MLRLTLLRRCNMGQRVLLIRCSKGEAWSQITPEGHISFHSLIYGQGDMEHYSPDAAVKRVRGINA